jgi:hypothetical protein
MASLSAAGDVSSSTVEPPPADFIASSSADGLAANTTVEPSAEIIASSSADGLVANTTVEVESSSMPVTFYFSNDSSDSQGQKAATFDAQVQKDVPID